jgi:hypothetical protein
MIYDDGSYDVTEGGTTYAYDTSGKLASQVTFQNMQGGSSFSLDGMGSYPPAYQQAPGYGQDTREQQKLGGFYPPSAPWWQGLATYGATRAIDAQFGPPPSQSNGYGTFAGQNGRTYAQGPNRQNQGGAADDGSGLILLALAGLAFYALAG